METDLIDRDNESYQLSKTRISFFFCQQLQKSGSWTCLRDDYTQKWTRQKLRPEYICEMKGSWSGGGGWRLTTADQLCYEAYTVQACTNSGKPWAYNMWTTASEMKVSCMQCALMLHGMNMALE